MGFGAQRHCNFTSSNLVDWNSMSNPCGKISKDSMVTVPPARHTIAWSQSEEDLTLRVLVETWFGWDGLSSEATIKGWLGIHPKWWLKVRESTQIILGDSFISHEISILGYIINQLGFHGLCHFLFF